MKLLRIGFAICTLLALAALAGSYLGALHPAGDSLAVFRLWLAGGAFALGLLSALFGARHLGGLSTVAAAGAALPILLQIWVQLDTPRAAPDLSVYVKNLGSARGDAAALIADIEASGADILLLQELTPENADLMQAALPSHPFWHICQFSGWSGMAVAARWPMGQITCSEHRSVALAEILTPTGPIRAASLHQVWPWPYEQAELLPMVLETLRSDAPRQIVAGDFNMVPWSHTARQIARATGTRRIGPVQTTIRIRHVPLQIDHVLTTGQGSVARRPQFGSDHYGLLARVGFSE